LESSGAARDYAFPFRGSARESSRYCVTIANDAFLAHRVRDQDAPDICSLRLRREFATQTGHPCFIRFYVTDAELTDYQHTHTPKTKPGTAAHRKDNQS